MVYGLNKQQWIEVLSAWLGWLLDGYTTIGYALVGLTISTVFFPPSLKVAGIVLTFAGFGVGALARSIGSLVFGNYLGDKLGRKNMLITTILGFSFLSASKSILPSYNQVGIIAPILLYIILFFEGMFAGAEYGGGSTLAMESTPPERRGFVGSFVQSGYGTGYFIVSLVLTGISLVTGKAFSTIGWRILFATALIPGLIAFLMRLFAKETKIFEEMKGKNEIERVPLKSLFKYSPKQMIIGLLITTGLLGVNTATFSFWPSVMNELKYDESLIGIGVAIINLISLFGVWFGGFIADKIGGRKIPMLIYALLFAITSYFLIVYGYTRNFEIFVTLFSIQAFIEAMIFSTIPAFLSEIFSRKYRTTGVGFTYNGGAIVGGFAISMIYAISYLGLLNAWIIILYLFTAIMLIGIILAQETWGRKINKDLIYE
ncbi:nitrate/nitrite transporter [Caldisphaera lagunensis DSM 15908]|uniref:Nitrate/nitrite transporter n=1 Tax=Caldisphaera lagunensis (strain DSM 15908 / JCM 11604 / ANMR 0165 / IC-154) TaxID=1056495 RepID=L0A967_CALLD|nr:MFS transporter [Caldisphaera lagunensis]AFZ69969.1 nitrate/nitrite transporter [Caldisphaera lagunensis DSM 15908]